MVYSTTFVGEVLKRYDVAAQESLQSSADVVGDIARVGSMALVMFSVVSLFSSVLLPWVVTSPESDEFRQKDPGNGSLANFLEAMIPFKPSLATAWICGHIMYASLMLMTLFVSTVNLAMLCVALSGV
jgi:solute carrier family 45 protein 1/2/4